MNDDSRRFFFFLGKGGVGKSTTSALAARHLAASGRRVLLLSLDPAHNQADIFDRPLSDRPTAVSPGLRVAEVDHRRWIDRYLATVSDQVRRSYNYATAFNLDHWFDVLRASPGIEEYALMLAFQHYRQQERDIDLMVLDMPPTALTLKFLRLPSLSLRWLGHLRELRGTLLQKKEILHRIRLGPRELETDRVLGRLEQQQGFYTELRDLLANPAVSRLHLVTNPERLSEREGERIRAALAEMGLAGGLQPVLNKVQEPVTGPTPGNPPHLPLAAEPLLGPAALDAFLSRHAERFAFLGG